MEKITFAQIGCGNNGQGHLKLMAANPGVAVVAAMDTDAEKLASLKEKFPQVRTYTDLDAMFATETLDAVCISTPHCFHYEQTIKALEHNCHVLVEKPMALKKEHCIEMANRAYEKKKLLQLGFECRSSKIYQRVREITASGELGKLLSMTFVHYRPAWLKEWYNRRELAGTMSLIETCHYIDLMRFFAGGPEADWAFAAAPEGNLRQEYGYPDTTFAQLHFDNGMLTSITDSHARSAQLPASTQSYGTYEHGYMDPAYGHQFEYTITGTEKSLWLRMLSKQISIFGMDRQNQAKPTVSLDRIEDYTKDSLALLTHDNTLLDATFINNIINRVLDDGQTEEAVKSHIAVFAICESETTGEKVILEKLSPCRNFTFRDF